MSELIASLQAELDAERRRADLAMQMADAWREQAERSTKVLGSLSENVRRIADTFEALRREQREALQQIGRRSLG